MNKIKKTQWMLALFFIGLASIPLNGQTTLLSYNVKHGFEGDSLTINRFRNWITQQVKPDVILYQEMNGFTKAKLRSLAKSYGHNYIAILNKESGLSPTHPLAITANRPIEQIEYKIEDMWHGYLLAKVNNLYIMVTHMAPFTLENRQKDVSTILKRIEKLPSESQILVAGDFNALARSDSARYGEKLLKSMMKLEGRLEPKSGTEIVKYRTIYRNNLNDGKLDYSVTDAMIAGGLYDAFHEINKSFKHTAPIKSNFTKNSTPRRIDYIWINKALLPKISSIDIVQNEYTENISDHYPLLMQIKK
ncbi:endonuclease/exonuclease/phosphatase family protein [Sphingobacterium hotanense]|uniref:endonuclease/exonuclease/phosphatase family protein n=1 Tax=Sphingobacterium hotanense TaxID=649196 RepID=UPI0021A3B01F|nr:endonuclease/exonuclease/phosphatase family protein [Sphingobacterium hotanense]MCT1524117.1 endonuclease/exonuclease/phosphatase family protein [Sphingobacterium hotanense]